MAKTEDAAFLTVKRKSPDKKNIAGRLKNYAEIYLDMAEDELALQAARCMNCGVPFCHNFGCPLGNLSPEWNRLLHLGRIAEAVDLLHSTNNFPEVTGRICPALCEAACTLGINDESVTIRQNELAIVEAGFSEELIKPFLPVVETGKKVAVIGSGPAGLAAAQQLRRVGHQVTVFEKSVRPGGILRFGMPDFKLEKWVLDRRLKQMREEGVCFETEVNVGVDVSAGYLRKRFDVICLCVGAEVARDLPVPGRELAGVHFALTYLIQQNLHNAGLKADGAEITAKGKNVLIIGGGDTGSDCLGTALRQGAKKVYQFEILPQPPEGSDPKNIWPEYPRILRTSSSHEEGGKRQWCVCTSKFSGSGGKLKTAHCIRVAWGKPEANGRSKMQTISGSEFDLEVELVILAMGFIQPNHKGLLAELELDYDVRSNIKVDDKMSTNQSGVFAAGDAASGASLVVRCIAGGRKMAREVDLYLMGETALPALD